MIHLFSSEAKAFILFTLLNGGLLVSQWLFPTPTFTGLSQLILLLVSVVVCRWIAKGTPYRIHCPSSQSFTGYTTRGRSVAIVTGASSGVGYAVTEALALAGWTVIAAGPDLNRLLVARRKILGKVKEQKNIKHERGDVVVLDTLDLSDEVSVRQFAAKVHESAHALPASLLINAAGVLKRHVKYSKLTTRWWELESMIATNAVGPMLLSLLLLPVLRKSTNDRGTPSRIINVASSCHTFLSLPGQMADPLNMIAGLCFERAVRLSRAPDSAAVLLNSSACADDIRGAPPAVYRIRNFNNLNFVQYYGLSKLCVIWNTKILSQYLSNTPASGRVRVACTHPGVICTHLYRDLFSTQILDRVLYYPSLVFGKTWKESAFSTLRAAGEDDGQFVDAGYYLCDGDHSSGAQNCLSTHAQNEEEQEKYRQWLSRLIPEMEECNKK